MKLHPKTKQAYQLFHKGTLALSRAEQQGIRVDLDYILTKSKHLSRKIEHLEDGFRSSKLYKHWEHSMRKTPNIDSDSQLRAFLYTVKKLKPPKFTESGLGSTDEETLLSFKIPELNSLIQIRKLKKIRDTYLEGFYKEQVNGYIHPGFNLHLVRTFRSSSDRPNFQNIPKRDKESMRITRKALYPRPRHQLLEVDYSGLEVRIAACYHQDPTMLKYINDPNSDMHADMASQILMMPDFNKHIPEHAYLRAAAKNGFVFPQFYGDYYGNCAEVIACKWGQMPYENWKRSHGVSTGEGTLGEHLFDNGITSLGKFTKHIQTIEDDFWGNRFREYARWKERWWKTYQKFSYIDLKTGFRCSGVMGKNDCINYPVQGAAFHCLLWSFIELDRIMREENWDTRLIGQIHDAIILDVNPSELEMVLKVIKRVTCQDLPKAWDWIITPLDVDFELCNVDKSWADKEEFEFV